MISMSEGNKKENKELHNYIIVILTFLLCIGIVLYVCRIYEIKEAEKRKIPVIRGSVLEIYKDDLKHYVMDNPTSLVYMCTANSDTCRTFEKSLKKLLQKEDYDDEIVYLNLTDLDQEAFVEEFNQEFPYKTKLTLNYPAFVLFEEGKVKNILQGTLNKNLTITKVKTFLELNEIGD